MLSEVEAGKFADDWIQAWNSHDLEAIMSHYAPEVVLTSPTAKAAGRFLPELSRARKLCAAILREGLRPFRILLSSFSM